MDFTTFDSEIAAFFTGRTPGALDAEGVDPVAKGWVGRSGESGEFTAKGTGGGAKLERDLSVRDILYGKYPSEKPRSKTVKQVARQLMQRGSDALRALGVESGRIEGPNPQTDELLSRVIASEIQDALTQKKRATHWYTKRMAQAMNLAAEMHPELATDRDARTAFTASLAITSQGEVVPSNVRLADQAYRVYRETGRFPTDVQAKERISMNTNFAKLNALLDAGSPAEMTEFLHTDFTVRELAEHGYDVGGENLDSQVKGSAILGAKIGQGFFQNLNGNYDPVTMDLWFMRGWGRLTGTLQGQLDPAEFTKTQTRFENALRQAGETPAESVADLRDRAEAISRQHESDYRKYRDEFESGQRTKSELVLSAQRMVYAVDGINQAPRSGGHRQWMRNVINRTREVLKDAGSDLTNADIQATWWYPEKDLYAKLGSREARDINVDYADALTELARKNGISERAIKRAIRAVDRRPGRAGATDDGGAVEGVWPGHDRAVAGEKARSLAGAIDRIRVALDVLSEAIDREFKEHEHKRDEEGKFAKQAGASRSFVSPSVGEGLRFNEARQALSGSRQKALSEISQQIDEKLGLTEAQSTAVIGAWADGAENSLMTLTSGDPQMIRAAAAMKGAIAQQKAVLVFQPGEGDDEMASFAMQGDLADIHDRLLQGGLAFHTLEPTEGGARVHILVQDDDTAAAITEVAQGAEIALVAGKGDFLGTEKTDGTDDEQRSDAVRVYTQVIEEVARQRQDGGPDLRAIWEDAHNYWSAATAGAEDYLDRGIARFFAHDREFRESDVKRDDDGKFATQAGGGARPAEPQINDPEFTKDLDEPQRMRLHAMTTAINTVHNRYGFKVTNPEAFKDTLKPIVLEDDDGNRIELDTEADPEVDEVRSFWDLNVHWFVDPKDGESKNGVGYRALMDALNDLPKAEELRRIQETIREGFQARAKPIASSMGYDNRRIEFSDEDHIFDLGGTTRKAAGLAYTAGERLGDITLFNKQLTLGTVEGITAHEVMHQKYQSARNDYDAEANEIYATDESYQRFTERDAQGRRKLKSEYAQRFPVFAALDYYYTAEKELAQADGVSDYSADYWQNYNENVSEGNFRTAVHETLAEMARIEQQTGTLPGEVIFQGLYGDTNDLWRKFYWGGSRRYDDNKAAKRMQAHDRAFHRLGDRLYREAA